MENNENNSGELNEKPQIPIQKSKLKIKRFRRKDGEKKQKKDPNTPKHPLTGMQIELVAIKLNYGKLWKITHHHPFDVK